MQYIEKALVADKFRGELLTMHGPRFTSVSHSAENNSLLMLDLLQIQLQFRNYLGPIFQRPLGIKLDIEGSEGVLQMIFRASLKDINCLFLHALRFIS